MWLTLFVIIFNRILFHNPIADKLVPTFFILFAPPAIAFISYVKLIGEVDSAARILYYISLFLCLLIFVQIKMFFKIKFYLSWWAYSFPMAAITIATMLMYHETENIFFRNLSYVYIIILSAIIFYLMFKTIKCMTNKKICIEEKE